MHPSSQTNEYRTNILEKWLNEEVCVRFGFGALSPDTIRSDAESVLLTVDGSGFTPQSQIMWNGNTLQTTFMDSHHLQTAITRQTFDSLGGSAGSSVQISVRSQGSVDNFGCPIGGNSAALVLVINQGDISRPSTSGAS